MIVGVGKDSIGEDNYNTYIHKGLIFQIYKELVQICNRDKKIQNE